MLFNSWQFIFVFLPITFFIYFALCHKHLVLASKVWLVAASLFFYSYWNINYLALILLSMFFNFAIGSGLAQTHPNHRKRAKQPYSVDRKVLLIIGITANLGLLGYFKYADFFIVNINLLTDSSYPLLNLFLPLAISFFTFQQITYLVDSYKGETVEYDLLNYSIFVTFFPQLIAGPIVHHHEMMSQFGSPRTWFIRYSNVVKGLFIFSVGLFKKVVIADTFAVWANAGFDSSQSLDFFAAWGASLSYTFQLYFDFSGYCDMAMGLALLFNIRLPVNFNSPYKALNIQDFWRRWHITLSRFLKDYVYVPLGGNRNGEGHTYFNILATFLLGGLWHGASWMFVFWGLLHGLALITHRLWMKTGFKLNRAISWLTTFLFLNTTWVFFRAVTWEDATRVLSGMIDFDTAQGVMARNLATHEIAWSGWLADKLILVLPAGLIPLVSTYIAIVFGFILITRANSVQLLQSADAGKQVAFGALLFVTASLFMLSTTSTVFLYFNF